jgi:hypothetical protein
MLDESYGSFSEVVTELSALLKSALRENSTKRLAKT